MSIRIPHPWHRARERRAREQALIAQAVRRARLADRTPQTVDLLEDEWRRRQSGGQIR